MPALYAPGLTVEVRDDLPVPVASSSASGHLTLFAPGLTVDVVDVPGDSLPVMHSRPLNMGRLIQFYDWASSGRYTRAIPSTFWPRTPGQKIQFTANDHGGTDTMLSGTYELLVQVHGDGDPILLASVTITSPVERTYFTGIDLSALPDGWHLFDIRRTENDGSTAHPYWMYVGTPQPQTWVPVQTGSFGITHEDGPTARWGKVPAQISPTKFTLQPRDAVPFSHAASRTEMFRRNLSPCTNGDVTYLHTLPNGVKTSFSNQGYSFNGITDKVPRVVLRDGPFGVGTLSAPMHLEYGTANIPEMGGYVDNIYFCDPWSFGKIRYVRGNRSNSGEIVRLAGYRHGDAGLELLGNWDSVPAERRGFNELWGCAWDTRTQATDLTADPIPAERDLRPHITGIALWLPDSRHNRIAHLKFDPRSHAPAPIVTEFAVGLADPWDCVYDAVGNELIVSERMANRVIALDPDTGAYIRTIIDGPAGYAYIDDEHRPQRVASLDAIRAQACICPEGLFIQDGWVYFASISMAQVKRVNLTTGAVEVACEWSPVGKSEYAKISLSDGTFGPRGTVFVSTWEVQKMGAPWAFLPGGTPWNYIRVASRSVNLGKGGEYEGIGYSTASGVSRGRLVYGGADYGLVELTLAQPGDVQFDEDTYEAGKVQYEHAGYRLTHGIDGFGQFGFPLPWGQSAEIDYYLTAHGHTQ